MIVRVGYDKKSTFFDRTIIATYNHKTKQFYVATDSKKKSIHDVIINHYLAYRGKATLLPKPSTLELHEMFRDYKQVLLGLGWGDDLDAKTVVTINGDNIIVPPALNLRKGIQKTIYLICDRSFGYLYDILVEAKNFYDNQQKMIDVTEKVFTDLLQTKNINHGDFKKDPEKVLDSLANISLKELKLFMMGD